MPLANEVASSSPFTVILKAESRIMFPLSSVNLAVGVTSSPKAASISAPSIKTAYTVDSMDPAPLPISALVVLIVFPSSFNAPSVEIALPHPAVLPLKIESFTVTTASSLVHR